MSDLSARAKATAKKLNSSKIWKMSVGDNCLRILPTPAGKKSDDTYIEIATHDNVGPQKSWLRCGIDPVTEKGKCWICQVLVPKLRKKGKESRIAALAPRRSMAVQIALVDTEDGTMSGPEVWMPSQKVQKGLVAKIFDSKKRNYLDPKKGYNLTYKRTGTGMKDTEYFGPDVDEEPSKVPSSIMSKLRPFDEVPNIPAYSEEKQKKAYFGNDADASGESEEEIDLDEEDSGSKKKGKGKKSSDESDEEASSEEESASSEEEDESEEEKPKGKKGKGTKSSEDSSEESSEESEEEDASEEEKPKGKKGKKKEASSEESEEEDDSEESASSEEEDEAEEEEKPKGKKKK